jgi:SNF2 family DNA or RNA helicase
MTKIIDNSKKKSLASVLRDEMINVDELAIASAYFNLEGYRNIREVLKNKPMKLLLGREPSESVKFEEDVIKNLESFDEAFKSEQGNVLSNEVMKNEDDESYFSSLQDADEYFKSPDVEIRKVKGRFFHGKAYMGAYPSFSDIANGFATVGSSNFTGGGMAGNRELNMLTTDREAVTELINWFLSLWKEDNSIDFKSEFLQLLENYVTTHSPYEVLAKALYEVYRPQIDEAKTNNLMKTLFPHQILSTIQASRILSAYNGVIIADSTGLGKTRVGINLTQMAINEGKNPLLIAPKSALDTTWKDEMDKTHVHIDPISSEYLSSHPDQMVKEYAGKDFIIIDEAHYFRAQSSNRYSALRDLMATGGKQIVLLTATPINNSLMDLYALLSLYLRDDAISDISPSLKGYFSMQQKLWINEQPVDMDPILRRFVVRTSRELAKALSKDTLNFPVRKLDSDPRNRYGTKIDYGKIDDYFDSMNFVYYDYAIDKLGDKLKLPDGTPISNAAMLEKRESLKSLVKVVIKINFFKRLESSIHAFKVTMETLRRYIEMSVGYAIKEGYFIPPKMKGGLTEMYDEDGEWNPPRPEEMFSGKFAEFLGKCQLDAAEKDEFITKCNIDVGVIKSILSELPMEDEKLKQTIERIRNIELEGSNGVILFTQYAATAEYVYGNLKNVVKDNIMLTTGSACKDRTGHPKDKTTVIKDFMKNGGYIVSTDVLSESQNLQNAQYVVDYDFPWNPVVLIQRAGRIDRIGSIHEEVFLINILPVNGNEEDPKSLSHFLSVMRKLYKRIDLISNTIGIDSTTLGEDASPRDFGIQEAIARNDPKILDVLMEKVEQFTKDPIETLAAIINKKGEKWLQDLPIGIGAYKHSSRNGLFILFRDGGSYYWMLKFFDGGKETIQNPNEIINLLLDGDYDNKGEIIDYTELMAQFKDLKSSLRKKIEDEKKIKNIQQGRKFGTTKQEREIYEALQKLGSEGMELSAIFNIARARQTVVASLNKALKEGDLLERAREVLRSYDSSTNDGEKNELDGDTSLRRVCWCLLVDKKRSTRE